MRDRKQILGVLKDTGPDGEAVTGIIEELSDTLGKTRKLVKKNEGKAEQTAGCLKSAVSNIEDAIVMSAISLAPPVGMDEILSLTETEEGK